MYKPGAYARFTIYDRKPRVISKAPFRDRVVHHAIMNVLEPRLDPTFIDDSYACRAGRGVHKAVDRYQHWARRYAYVMKLDVSRYFPSIDHDRLKQKLATRPVSAGVDVLGYRVFPHRRRVRADNGYRYRRRLHRMARAYARGEVSLDAVHQSIQSWIGHVQHADSLGLRSAILSDVVFQPGSTA